MGSYKEPQLDTTRYTDPNDPLIRAPDTSPQRSAMLHDIFKNAALAREQAMRSSRQALGGSTSSAAGQFADIAAQQGYAQQKGLADLGQQDFANRMALMQQMNQGVDSRNQIEVARAQNENAARSAKAAELQALLNSMIGAGGLYMQGQQNKQLTQMMQPQQPKGALTPEEIMMMRKMMGVQ